MAHQSAGEPSPPPETAHAVERVRDAIGESCRRAGRSPDEVRLIAVTKGVAVERILAARSAGIADFGENRARDLGMKAALVPATWHFIGKLQRGTAHRVAEEAHVVHSAEPGHGLARLARRAVDLDRTLRCLAQVDFTGRRQGVPPAEVPALVEQLAGMSPLRLCGLMTMPPWSPHPEGARPYFARLRGLRDELAGAHPDLTELSMGMSADFQVAVEEGATMVRIGTALFGERPGGHAARADGASRGDTGTS